MRKRQSRGKASPNAATKLKLFTDSAGYCQNPECDNEIFPKGFENFPHIAEMAHIFAATDGGPRTDMKLSKEERGAYKNIILLCANCHTLVDKTPQKHAAELMQSWKLEHEFRRQEAFGWRAPIHLRILTWSNESKLDFINRTNSVVIPEIA